MSLLLCCVLLFLSLYVMSFTYSFISFEKITLIYFFHNRNKVLKIDLKFSLNDNPTAYKIKLELGILLEKETT